MSPALVISLDFELYWGLRDVRSLDSYRDSLEGVRRAIPRMLALFDQHGVHATWAVVGLVGMRDSADASEHAPTLLPEYADRNLCPFDYIRASGGGLEPSLHFAPDLVEQIQRAPGQELATHTFSHFYCLEPPQSLAAFRADLDAAQAVARSRFGAPVTSLVFPRNQYSRAHIEVAAGAGITAYRGNPRSWLYEPRSGAEESLLRRGARLADAFLPVTRDPSFRASAMGSSAPFNVAASRFLRPWTPSLAWAERYRLGRIQRELATAARRGRIYHLWWHPHNFGRYMEQNIASLETLLATFARLRDAHGMESLSMREASALATRATRATSNPGGTWPRAAAS